MIKIPSSKVQKLRGWGTLLDYQNRIPTQYVGKSFDEAWHDDIEKFKELSDEQKWEMGYWIEHQAYKSAGKAWLVLGLVIGVFAALMILNLLA